MRVRIRVQGVVQGVGFRYHTKQEAIALGLSGFARNEADGSVLIEAQGKEEKIKHFVAFTSKGPRHASVTSHHMEEIPEKNEDGFITE